MEEENQYQPLAMYNTDKTNNNNVITLSDKEDNNDEIVYNITDSFDSFQSKNIKNKFVKEYRCNEANCGKVFKDKTS